MVLRFLVSLCSFAILAPGYAQGTQRLSSAELQGVMARSGREAASYAAYLDEAAVLLAGRDPEPSRVGAARDALARASRLAAPSPRWFVLMAEAERAGGQPQRAAQLLEEGRAAYPYSNRLRVADGLLRIDRGQLSSRAEVLALDLPAAARYELAAELALRDGDYLRASLDAERAYYLSEGQVDAQRLVRSCMGVYALLLEANSCEGPTLSGYASGSLEEAYARSVRHVVRRAHSAPAATSSLAADGGHAAAYAAFRARVLRHFAAEGHLGRFDDPVLTDLYVLDRAGYLAWATEAMLLGGDPDSYRRFVDRDPGLARDARAYMASRWARDVEALEAGRR